MEKEFVLDITEGKSREQLAADYLRILGVAFHWQQIAFRLVEAAPEALNKLQPEHREEIQRHIDAYKD